MSRILTYAEALLEGTDQCMERDESVYLMGLGVPDPKGIFGSTTGLQEKYGSSRVMDMPVSENAMTGVALGSALVGKRPILTHQRLDFALLSLDQIINNASKWHYMFDGEGSMPIVIRLIIGRGWGQGPQHSQNLASIFAHIPGLKVLCPCTPSDAKGLLVAGIEDNNPVIMLEHRWLYSIQGEVPIEPVPSPIGKARVAQKGKDITLVTSSYWTLECLRAAEYLRECGVEAEVLDLRSLRPLDREGIATSVSKTGHLLVVDGAWPSCGVASEIITIAVEHAWDQLKSPPQRLCFPDVPTPTSWALARDFYPTATEITGKCCRMLGIPVPSPTQVNESSTCDTPDPSFTGPF